MKKVAIVVGLLTIACATVRPASTESVERTPERLERGRYLVENVAMCMHCHAPHDYNKLGAPMIESRRGAGGLTVDEKVGFPGSVPMPNITPDVETGIGAWTDGEIIRAIREGIDKHGDPIFPMMPYQKYREELTLEDTRAIVVYLRSLQPIKAQEGKRELPFPLGIIATVSPKPVEVEPQPIDPKDTINYGRRLVVLGQCAGCHSQFDKGDVVKGTEFGGGREFIIPLSDGTSRVITPNISSDPETGYFGRTNREAFIARVKSWKEIRSNLPDAQKGTNSVMPWLEMSEMTDDDLNAIYDYMKTVAPVKNVVQVYPDAPQSAVATR